MIEKNFKKLHSKQKKIPTLKIVGLENIVRTPKIFNQRKFEEE